MSDVHFRYTVEHQTGPFCAVTVDRLKVLTVNEAIVVVPDVFQYLTEHGFTVLGLGYGGVVFCRRALFLDVVLPEGF